MSQYWQSGRSGCFETKSCRVLEREPGQVLRVLGSSEAGGDAVEPPLAEAVVDGGAGNAEQVGGGRPP